VIGDLLQELVELLDHAMVLARLAPVAPTATA